MLTQFRKQAIQYTTLLKQSRGIDYEKVNVNILADGYCKACDENNEYDKNLFISALVLRFWFVIKKLQDKSPGVGMDITDFFSWLVEAIEYACKYRKWQDPENKVNAQQCINQCIETIRLQHYYQANLKKHKGDFNLVSLNTTFEDDSEACLLDTLENEEETESINYSKSANDARLFIQRYIDKKKIIEAIILDNIAFGDVVKETKHTEKQTNTYIDDETGEEKTEEEKVIKYTNEFWEFKCVQNLSKLSTDYVDYFLTHYNIKPEELTAALNVIHRANNNKLYTYLRKCLESCRTRMGAR